MAEMLTMAAVLYGWRQNGPSVTAAGGVVSCSSGGNRLLTKMIEPGRCTSAVEPKATVLSRFLAAR